MRLAPAKSVATLNGWLHVDGDVARLFGDPTLNTWLDIPPEKIVHQIRGADRPQDDGKSVIWVEADTPVKMIYNATAQVFSNAGDLVEHAVPHALVVVGLHLPGYTEPV